jgi:hypothetical protein
VVRLPCRVCRRPAALTRRGNVWWHRARVVVGPTARLTCRGAGHPPLGRPGPDLDPHPQQVLADDPLAREHPSGTVYLLHFDRPFGHARHYSGFAMPGNLAYRMAHHRAGSGANLLRHVAAAGISWELVRTWPGDRSSERQIKRAGHGPRYCPRCDPALRDRLLARLATAGAR